MNIQRTRSNDGKKRYHNMGKQYAYCRVSTRKQKLDRQIENIQSV